MSFSPAYSTAFDILVPPVAPTLTVDEVTVDTVTLIWTTSPSRGRVPPRTRTGLEWPLDRSGDPGGERVH